MNDTNTPPRLAQWLLRALVRRSDREFLIGDLTEEFYSRVLPQLGPSAARRWYWQQVRYSLLPCLFGAQSRSTETLTGGGWWAGFGQDIRFAARSLSRRPGFLLMVLVTLALGIGATTAMFSIVNAVVLRPLPFPVPDRMVLLFEADAPSSTGLLNTRPGNFFEWKKRNRAFEAMSAYSLRRMTLTGGDRAELLWAHRAAPDFFETLGVQPSLGRTFLSADYQSGRAVVLADSLWRSRFAADPRVLGREVSLDGGAYTVVGVMPPGFYPSFVATPQVWVPLPPDPALTASRVDWILTPIARLKSGVSLEQAAAEMDRIGRQLRSEYSDSNRGLTVAVRSMTDYVLGQNNRLFVLLFCAVGLLLLIACVNVANLLLARAHERTREIAVRTAIGASRFRLARQLLTEGLLLSLLAGALGIVLARASVNPIRALLPESSRVPRLDSIHVDASACIFALVVSIITGTCFGLLPALRVSGSHAGLALKEYGRGNTGGALGRRVASALIVAEVALSLTLLSGAGLVLRSFLLLESVDPGMRTDHLLTLQLRIPAGKYASDARISSFTGDLLQRISVLPGVQSAAVASQIPFEQGYNPWGFIKAGQTFDARPAGQSGHIQRVSPDYFTTLGIPLIRGRYLRASDVAGIPNAVVINQTMANRYWRDADPVGATITVDLTKTKHTLRIVGIVGDAHFKGLGREIFPEMFWPIAQFAVPDCYLLVRTAMNPAAIAPAVRAEMALADPDLPVLQLRTMNQILAESLWRQRLATTLLGLFSILALILSAAGLYGVIARVVSQRTAEFGLRITLGATGGDIVRLVLRNGLALTGSGIVIGLGISILFTRLLSTQLFGIQTLDPLTIAVVCAILFVVAMAASFVPAIRALRIDPAQALRSE